MLGRLPASRNGTKHSWGVPTAPPPPRILGTSHAHQLQTPQPGEHYPALWGRATAVLLTSAFSSLLWASTCATISFMLVSSTIPPITTSCKMW